MSPRDGEDEFTILAPNTPLDAGTALAERIRSRIAANATGWPLTASIGVASVTSDDAAVLNVSALMRPADTAMYQAKRRGKNAGIAWRGSSSTRAARSVT